MGCESVNEEVLILLVPPLEVCFLKSVGAEGRPLEDCAAAAAPAANGPARGPALEAEALAPAVCALRKSGLGAAGCANVWPTNCDWRCGGTVPGGPIRRPPRAAVEPHSASVDRLIVCMIVPVVKDRFAHTVFEMLAPEAVTDGAQV